MIHLYVQAGLVTKKPVVAFILKSPKYTWLKTKLLKHKLTKKQTECLGALMALKHIAPKFRKNAMILVLTSPYLLKMLEQDKDRCYVHERSSVQAMNVLRDALLSYPSLMIQTMEDDKYKEELMHVYTECGLDNIELDEKD